MISIYIAISWVIFFVVLSIVLINDLFERYELFGFKQDRKFGSSVTGMLWPITATLVISTLPFVNLIWVPAIAFIAYNEFTNKGR